MLDIQYIRENKKLVAEKARAKGYQIDDVVDELIKIDTEKKKINQRVDEIRSQRKKLAEMHHKDNQPKYVQEAKELREKEKQLLSEVADVERLFEKVPNIFADDTPIGGEEANKPEKHVGKADKKEVKDHVTWAEEKGFLDFERGAKVAGNKFYYSKGALVELELACIQLAMQVAIKHGFTPMTVPHMVNEKTANGTGFSPRGEEDQIYVLEGQDLSLIATSEIPITGYHAGEILDVNNLPILYVGLSPAYRKEAGAYGKHSKGLYRVHQFNKVEMYVFCEGDLKESEAWHKKLVEIEEEICEALDIPYQLVRIASGDLGAPAYKKYDIEYWSPVEGEYRELMSCSNVTDYQSRRLKIRYKDKEGNTKLVHTLNGTAMAFSRVAIALIENHQDNNGNVAVPKALQPYMNGKEKI